jgi:hypothetical protein
MGTVTRVIVIVLFHFPRPVEQAAFAIRFRFMRPVVAERSSALHGGESAAAGHALALSIGCRLPPHSFDLAEEIVTAAVGVVKYSGVSLQA